MVEPDPATRVRMRRNGGEWIELEDEGGGEFETETEDFGSLAGLNAALAGNWEMEITHGVGVSPSTYIFTLREAVLGDFPPLPVLNPPPEVITNPPPFNFSWTSDLVLC